MGYGVMVAPQILVLLVSVRIRITQRILHVVYDMSLTRIRNHIKSIFNDHRKRLLQLLFKKGNPM